MYLEHKNEYQILSCICIHSSTLAWKIPWTEEPGRLQSMGSLRVGHNERLHFHFSLSCIGEGNGNPLQCSCLENPKDGRAWWAAIYGVAQSRTRLKWLSSSSSSYVKRLEWEGTCLRKYSWQAAEPAVGPISLLEEPSHWNETLS